MCGICGFSGPGGRLEIEDMTRKMIHRGPDGEGFFYHPSTNTWLGHRRLSIIDLAGGAQPMISKDSRYVIIFNGEIYNHLDLRVDLEAQGYVFQTSHSDTETLLVGYAAWGLDLIPRLNGMWALAILDQESRTLFLSRDRFGQKPLFYHHAGDKFIFASELTALIAHPSLNASVSELSLQKYFAYGFIPAPHSLYQGINKLPAGRNMLVSLSDMSIRLETYWQFQLEPEDDPISGKRVEAWCEEIRELLQRAVTRRLMSDVPLGAFLSGGIDSTSVSALANRNLPPGTLKTFTIGFDEAGFDESHWAATAARELGIDHYQEKLSISKARDLAPSLISTLDEPLGDGSILPTWLLSKITRRQVTVALGGDGSDELFAGYDPFKALKLADFYQKHIPWKVHRAIGMAVARIPVSHSNMSLDFKIKRTLRGLSYCRIIRNPIWLGPLEPSELEELFTSPVDIEKIYEEAIQVWCECRSSSIVDQTLMFYTRLYLSDDILVKVDRAGMLNSLEVRAPFLDIEVADFLRRLPASVKYRHGATKWILRKAMKPLVPARILHRPKKGFGIPFGKWITEGAFTFDFERLNPLMRAGFCRRKLSEHQTQTADHSAFLWNLFTLGMGNRKAIKNTIFCNTE